MAFLRAATLLGAQAANVLDKLPKKLQPEAKERLHAIWQAATRQDAETAFERFIELYQAKYDKK